MQISKENIDKILSENDMMMQLSEEECMLMLDILSDKKDKCGSKLATVVRKWKTTAKEKQEISDEYVKISDQIRLVRARLETLNK